MIVVAVAVAVAVVAVVVLTLTRILFKSVVTGEAPVTLEWRNSLGKKTRTKTKVVYAYKVPLREVDTCLPGATQVE